MPVLKEYAESNDKEGYFVHAHISDLPHPLPLQVPDVTAEIYNELGYEPTEPGPDGGVDVPNELTWLLYDVGLHWTENTGPRGDPRDLDPDDLRDAAGPELTTGDIDSIIEFGEDYRGEYKSRVENLREKLSEKTTGSSSTSTASGGGLPSIQRQFDESLKGSGFDDDVEDLLEEWVPSNVYTAADVEAEDSAEISALEIFGKEKKEYRDQIASVPNIEDRIREYDRHPWTVKEIYPRKGGLEVSFGTADSQFDGISNWEFTDLREVDTEADMELMVGIGGSRSIEFSVEEGFVSDFEITIGYRPLGRFDTTGIEDWEYELHGEDPNRVVHTMLFELAKVLPMIGEFVAGLDDYELVSVEFGEIPLDLPA